MTLSLAAEAKLSFQLPSPEDARAIRIRAGIPASRLARELGVHPNTLCRWEAGTRRPVGDLRVAYARVIAELNDAITVA